ncbi:phosphomethylpyrimidine synthase [Desulforamulus putei DSM 12395]|uniref:Phosphomethylpyrimidine synthase n=1 Tax=Desulforamulus putei DSM 12395 TaxID=1121429 RepID=A0A1M4WKJ1_9FIRM|nr:phosphomethylpyrimidine synthase ThiC [Desulforamulus putei]SHE81714.1 phosphomethylpyrimidine synthase [Desulforamulus putei DSM 12395]
MYRKNSTSIKDTSIVKLRFKNGWIEAGRKRKTLVAALIGANNEDCYKLQLRKIELLSSMLDGPDIISDLSIIRLRNKKPLWLQIIMETGCIAATVPVYVVRFGNRGISSDELLDICLEQMEQGVGIITIHPTPTKELFELSQKRLVPCTSRGGGIVLQDAAIKGWKQDNVYLTILPELISAAKKYGTVISIGTTFRSANIFDSNDEAQQKEIRFQLDLAKKIAKDGVGVIIESPGHARPEDIKKIASILREGNFPVMPLGPIPTDIAIGMDHVSAAIGATLLGLEGCAHILAAVTREEHTGGTPTIESTIEAVKAARIAAHIIDIHILKDDAVDLEIAKYRGEHSTCIFGQRTKGCERCGGACPL